MNDDLPSFLQDFKDIFQEYFDSPHQLDSFLMKLNAIWPCESIVSSLIGSEKKTYVNYLTEMKVLVVSKRSLSTLGPQTCTEPVWAKEN